MHLEIAERLRVETAAANGRLLRLLEREWPAFYLGSVAPDVQTINGADRVKTHFYDVPPGPDEWAYPAMFASYPELAATAVATPAQAVFVAGYCFHLMLDLIWFRQILIPFFVEASEWGDFPQRRLAHHALLTYLDKRACDALPPTAAATLTAARPRFWVPFVADADLVAWRDYLGRQLQPGQALQTVAVYAGRLNMPPESLAENLNDADWMAANVFQHIPVDEVKARLATAVPRGVVFMADYLARYI